MSPANLGAVRLPFLAAAVLASFSPLSAQVVEKGRTFADLTATHPCSSAYLDRIARVTDCDAADDIGDGAGAFQCWATCDGSAPWAAVSIGGGAGGGAATAVQGDATLPATCTEKDLYQDTNSGGTELYVCTATNTWTKAGTGDGTIGGTLTATDDLLTCTDGTGGSTIGACTVGNLDNLRLDGNTLSSTDTNGHILIDADGTGRVQVMNGGSAAAPSFVVGPDTDTGFYDGGTAGYTAWTADGQLSFYWDLNSTHLYRSSYHIVWEVGGTVGLQNIADDILKVTDGSTGFGWTSQDGKKALASDYTNATATFSNLTGLSTTLKVGRKYTFEMSLRFSDSTASDGANFDFDGGTATATDFGVNCQVFDTALLLSQDSTALATDFSITTATGASKINCTGSFIVNAAGTFIPRAAQETDGGGTLTVEAGSYLHVTDTSFN